MKSNTFNYSLLAVGVATLMGLSTGASAAPSSTPTATESGNAGTKSKTIRNVATASYSVGDQTQKPVSSNEVTVNINEVISFSLTANNIDDVQNDDKNLNSTVVPEGFVTFKHTLTNTGNLDDTYSFALTDSSGGKYNLAGSNANVIIKDAAGVKKEEYTINGIPSGSFPLLAGYSVEITINAKTTGNQGGSTQNLQLSVTSTKIAAITSPANGATETLTNTDQSSTVLPVFSIAKTITSGTFNVNDSTAEVSYEVVVKNVAGGYSTDATNVTIEDFLPDGLIMSAPLAATNITLDGNATIGATITNTSKGFSFVATSLPQDGKMTIKFKAKKDKDVPLAQNALNHVTVTDDLDDGKTATNTLVDSTDGSKETNINFYPTGDDTNITNGTSVDGTDGNDSTQPLNSIQRSLTLTNPQTIQIPTTTNSTTQANHSVTITNTGRDSETNLSFTLAKSDTAENVSVSNVQINGTGTVLTADAGVYTIPDTLAAGANLKITYVVTSTDAEVGQKEETTVTLVPSATPGNPPTVNPVVDTTQVRGIELAKTQALDANCDGNPEGSFVTTSFNVDAGQCVVYNIRATNTFDSSVTGSYSIASLVISDDLVKNGVTTNADYLTGSANNKNISGSPTTGSVTAPSANNQVASNTVGTLAPQATANLQFTVKIKQN
ncbi:MULTISPECIES: hypothetical protein [unclassified Psychrobacter]|uniref:hypothetical protein n=1 Tax=unclassified Psychrobacter TaxID=196806 RepID=UPI0025E5F8CE|nr:MULTISPECIES: hypothetical protein [unclassified Psychrobacter]